MSRCPAVPRQEGPRSRWHPRGLCRPGHERPRATSSTAPKAFACIRLKHFFAGNSVKIYDKHGTVLRTETTINDPSSFKVYRTTEGNDAGTPEWLPMRKGVADLTRRTEVSQAVNDRYLDAVASCEDSAPLGELTADVCRPVTWHGRRVRALHPWSPHDLDLLRTVGRAEFVVNGFRNADLCHALHGTPPKDSTAHRRRSAAVTRSLRLLRAHGLVHKRPKSHRYMVSPKGHRILSALLAAYQANAESLTKWPLRTREKSLRAAKNLDVSNIGYTVVRITNVRSNDQ